MLFTTPTEWAALGFTLIAGWLFGLASSSGGKKWKRQLEEAELNYASARDRDEAELWNAQIRIRDLERELRDSRPAPSATPVVATAAAAAAAPTLIERVQEAAQEKAAAEPVPAPAPQPEASWIPEGPPPPPLPMGTVETQPVDPTPAPALVQEEVAPASPVATFPAAESPAPAAAGGADSAAAGTHDQGEPAGSVSEAQPSNDWLPPHVRADPRPHD
jgi:hypothetical protein